MPCNKDTEKCPAKGNKTPINDCCRGHLLEIIKDVTSVFEEEKIKYWADYGTLLGAVRHNGLIPWDSDADFGILEKDFGFVYYCLLEKLKHKYVVRASFDGTGFQVGYSRKNKTHVDIFSWYEENKVMRRRKYIGLNSPTGTDTKKGRAFLAEWVDELYAVQFEDFFVYVPKDPKRFCKFRYGKSWEIPMSITEFNKTNSQDNLILPSYE